MPRARWREFEIVLVYRYDRFARSLRQLVSALDEFNALGVGFVSLHEGVDSSTPNGRLVFGIFASIAEFERELIRERVRSGIGVARARGKQLGRPKLVLDAARILERRAQGESWQHIADDLKVSRPAVQEAAARWQRHLASQKNLLPDLAVSA
jgi:DNA invertase Pin-like site-specific DNA recombinase